MGVLKDAAILLYKYPLTFAALGAAATLVAPVAAVTLAGPLRPWARRILSDALAVRREATRIASESKDAYADLLAEVESESAMGAAAAKSEPFTSRVRSVTEPTAHAASPAAA